MQKGIDIMRLRFRAFIFCVAALAPFVTADCAFAFERGATFTVLPGTTMGLPFAYTGTPGLYVYSLGNYGTVTAPSAVSPNVGAGPGTIHADVADEVPALLWTTPWTLFGATYAVLISQPMVSSHLYGQVPGVGPVASHNGGLRNTIVTPINLSWNVSKGWYVGLGFTAAVPDGEITGINGLDRVGAPYWTLEPTVAVSYLRNGWDLSATFLYDIYTANPYSGVTDGQAFYADLTATKKFDHLEIGPVAYLAVQTTNDSGGSPAAFIATRGVANSCEPVAPNVNNYCMRAARAGVGGKIGYDIGRAQIALLATQSVLSRGQGGADGWRIWTQLSWKIY
ncbi:MAG: SphA family protein [Methylovirgula sp.]